MIRVKTAQIEIDKKLLGKTRDRHTIKMLREELNDLISSSGNYKHEGDYSSPTDLQKWIDDFSEHPSKGAVENVKVYFSKLVSSGYTYGGRRAHSKPLLYPKESITPSKEDIGAIGEGIVGFYLENIARLSFHIRPFRVSPDMIFKDGSKKHLVEVKSSLGSKDLPLTVAIELLEILAKTKFIRAGKYYANVFMVNIKNIDDYEIKRLTMEER